MFQPVAGGRGHLREQQVRSRAERFQRLEIKVIMPAEQHSERQQDDPREQMRVRDRRVVIAQHGPLSHVPGP